MKKSFSSAPLLHQIPRKLVFHILRMTDLIFQCGRHKERKNLVKQRPSTKFTSLVCYLSQGCFPHRRGTIFDLQQQFHDLSLFQLFWTQSAFINIHLKRKKQGKLECWSTRICIIMKLKKMSPIEWEERGNGI